jgi:glucose/arabinose dehydrogenase
VYGAQYQNGLFLAAMLLRDSDSIISYIGSPPGARLHIERDENGALTKQQRIMLGDVRVRSVAQGLDGYLYVLTDQTGRISAPGTNGGALWKLDRF